MIVSLLCAIVKKRNNLERVQAFSKSSVVGFDNIANFLLMKAAVTVNKSCDFE